MPGIYIGSTAAYSGKNLAVLSIGLWLKKQGLRVGYMKPVGAMPTSQDGRQGDEDAFFVQQALGIKGQDPALVTPVLVTRDFRVQALLGAADGLMGTIKAAYAELSRDVDVMLVAGSGSMYSGRYCGVDGVAIVKELGLRAVVVDRFDREMQYDYLLVLRQALGERLAGVIVNDVPDEARHELEEMVAPFLRGRGVNVLGILPRDALLSSITVADLAEKLGARVVTAHARTERVVERFLIGTMQVENFLTHFKRARRAAVIVGGDRSDVQLVAMEGDCPCLILTGNLFPNDIVLTRSEVLEIPILVVREDTFSVAKKMEAILSRHKLRDAAKIEQGARLFEERVDMAALAAGLEERRAG